MVIGQGKCREAPRVSIMVSVVIRQKFHFRVTLQISNLPQSQDALVQVFEIRRPNSDR